MSKPFRLAVKAILFDEQGRCLLLRRSKVCGHFVGKWEWPGGKLDEGEDFASAVVRETREETGLEVEVIGLGGSTIFEMPAAHIVLLCMEVKSLGGQIKISEEHDEFAWAPLDELGKWELTDHARAFMLEYAQRKLHA
jgi:8-oxo-dGTP diphosphatase